MSERRQVLDLGYVELIQSWGSDEQIVEAARMSTAKGFLGWGPKHAPTCPYDSREAARGNGFADCNCREDTPGDEKLLKFLWDNAHATPFEMAGLTIEVKAPIMVFREWHRHRVPFGYNEMSARYVPLPDENYVPTLERLMTPSTANKQAQSTGAVLRESDALDWLAALADSYEASQRCYEFGLKLGVPKELARLPVPVARYSVMRATGNLRGWLGFMKLRCAPNAQWEIRQFANVVADLVRVQFPRTYEVAHASLGLSR